MDVFGDIAQGIRTGANQVFIVDANGDHELEQELLVPFVNGEDIRRLACNTKRRQLKFPYSLDAFGNPNLIPEAILRDKHPQVWSHLAANRRILDDRSLGQKHLGMPLAVRKIF